MSRPHETGAELSDGPTAFVLGGGGLLGAAEVGMLQALTEAAIAPDLVLGTSVGALNGAAIAAAPTALSVHSAPSSANSGAVVAMSL